MNDNDIPSMIATLDYGLILRRANPADLDTLATFHALVHADDDGVPDANIEAWVRELMSGDHPTFQASDFTIIETSTGEIVSSLCLISQTWTYASHPIKVGRIELVSTHADYRRRGLVRRQMDIAHQWSAERGELIQAVSGIPNFYRQFGYEMALQLGGGQYLASHRVPSLGKDEAESFTLRSATVDDAPFIADLEKTGRRRWLLTAVRDAEHWRYEIKTAIDPKYAMNVAIIENEAGEATGYVVHYGDLTDSRLATVACELTAGTSWLGVMPSLLRGLASRGEALGATFGSGPLRELYFGLGGDHPLYQVLPQHHVNTFPPYAWFIRVPDLPGLLREISPVLEERITSSAVCGHSGELKLNFFTSGVRIELEDGRLAAIEPWTPPDTHSGGATFPDLSFLHLIVGHRSLADLRHAFADCRINSDDARVLLEILFPKLPSRVFPID